MCFWEKKDEWNFGGTPLRLNGGDSHPLWRDLIAYGDAFGWAAPSTKAVLEKYQEMVIRTIERDAEGGGMTFNSELKEDSSICSGPE